MITKEDLAEAINYIFRNTSPQETENILYITDNSEYLSFRCGDFTTGLEGIKDFYKAGIGLGLTDICYNGIILKEEEREIILNKLFAKK